MNVRLIDKKENKTICTADILFGLDVLIVEQCQGMKIEELQNWLEERVKIRNYTYEMDDIILKKLNLYHKKHLFGRMDEACVLYAMLTNFEDKNDNLALFPQKDEFVCMIAYNPNYSNLYLWRTYHDINA